jgi:hypothetical protein
MEEESRWWPSSYSSRLLATGLSHQRDSRHVDARQNGLAPVHRHYLQVQLHIWVWAANRAPQTFRYIWSIYPKLVIHVMLFYQIFAPSHVNIKWAWGPIQD